MLTGDKTPEAEVHNRDRINVFPLNFSVLPSSALSHLTGGLFLQETGN